MLQVKIIHDLVHPNILRFHNWCGLASMLHSAACGRSTLCKRHVQCRTLAACISTALA
jgi:hypothetical protein